MASPQQASSTLSSSTLFSVRTVPTKATNTMTKTTENDKVTLSAPPAMPLVEHCLRILNYLASYAESGPFMLPVPSDASIYHANIEQPMDLTTIERRLYSGHYTSTRQFEGDLQLVWKNAVSFNDKLSDIHRKALALEKYYETMDAVISKDKLKISCVPVELSLPANVADSIPRQGGKSAFYLTMAIHPEATSATTKRLRGYAKVRPLYDELHGPLFESILHPSSSVTSLPRLYISKNRSCFKEAISSSGAAVFTILWNAKFEPSSSSKDQIVLTTNVTLAETFEESFNDMLTSTAKASASTQILSDLTPKAWVKIRPITTHHDVQTIITKQMESVLFRRPYTTHRVQPTSTNDPFLERLVHCMTTGESDLRPVEEIKSKEQHVDKAPGTIKDEVDDTPAAVQAIKEENDNKNDSHQHHDNTLVTTPTDQHVDSPSTPTSKASQLSTITVNEDDSGYKEAMEDYRARTTSLFSDLKQYSKSKGVDVVSVQKYVIHTTAYANAEGFFKQVRYVNNNKNIVVQTFRRMTTSQRAIELISLLKLKGLPHMAEITEVLHAGDNSTNDIVGLAMRRYHRTLKQYTHSHTHHRLTAHQKMDLIRQMLRCLECIHDNGIAHRDLSEVNFMVDENDSRRLEDGSVAAHVYLIDFGKAVFTRSEDVKRWWIQPVPTTTITTMLNNTSTITTTSTSSTATTATNASSTSSPSSSSTAAAIIPTSSGGDSIPTEDYEGEVIPENKAELEAWCTKLPWVPVKPDHGYRCYRSIQTLPRNRTDHAVLPWLVNPIAEDMYSIGALIWKVFAETEPWHGILDTDLRGLRDIVGNDDTIRIQVHREVAGDLSRRLLLMCLRTQPDDRASASSLLAWLDDPEIATGLLEEWRQHAPTERKKRHAKATFEFEEEQAAAMAARAKKDDRKKQKRVADVKKKKMEAEAEKAKIRAEKQRKKDVARLKQDQELDQEKIDKQRELQQQRALQQQFRLYENEHPGYPGPHYGGFQQHLLPGQPHGQKLQHYQPPLPLYSYPPHPPFVQFSQPNYYAYQQRPPYQHPYFYPHHQQQQHQQHQTRLPYPPTTMAPPLTSTASSSASSSSSPSPNLPPPLRPTARPPLQQAPMTIHANNADQNPYLSRISRPTSNVRTDNRHQELSFIMMNPGSQ